MNYDELFYELENLDFNGVYAGIFVVIAILVLIVFAVAIILYVFQGISLSQLAKKNSLPNPWLAWLPVGNMYLLGKLGFEIYAPDDKKNEVFTWVLFGCSIASIALADSGLTGLIGIAIAVFTTWAYYYIFNKINSKNCVLFTVLTAIFSIGGVLLFFNRQNFTNENVVSVKKEEPVKEKKSKEVAEQKEEKKEEKAKYCSNCGNKVNKTSKFCSKCGNKI